MDLTNIQTSFDLEDGGRIIEQTVPLLRLSGPDDKLTGFSYFWLKYVRDFDPSQHCGRSLIGHYSKRVYKTMRLGLSVALDEVPGYRHLYLCGLAFPWRPPLDLQLVMLPDTKGRIERTLYNGLVLQIEGATELPIPDLPDGFAGRPRPFTTCCNWQFGVAYYGLTPS